MGVLITDRIDGIRLTRLDSGLTVATDAMAAGAAENRRSRLHRYNRHRRAH